MIKFDKPLNLNGSELIDELKNVGILLDIATQAPFIDDNNDLWLDIEASDRNKAAAIIAAHNGTVIAPETKTIDKLMAAGLTLEELKNLLA